MVYFYYGGAAALPDSSLLAKQGLGLGTGVAPNKIHYVYKFNSSHFHTCDTSHVSKLKFYRNLSTFAFAVASGTRIAPPLSLLHAPFRLVLAD